MLTCLVNCDRNVEYHSANIYLLKVNTRNIKSCEICSELTIKTPEWRLDLEHVSHIFRVFLLLTRLWLCLGNLAGISEDDIKQMITSMQVLEIVASNLQESLTERVGIGFLLMMLESESQLRKKLFCLFWRKPFKYDEKCFLFHVKSIVSSYPQSPQANPPPRWATFMQNNPPPASRHLNNSPSVFFLDSEPYS